MQRAGGHSWFTKAELMARWNRNARGLERWMARPGVEVRMRASVLDGRVRLFHADDVRRAERQLGITIAK